MITIRPDDFNMPTIVGQVMELTGEHHSHLPKELHLIAYGNGNDYDVYLDKSLPHVKLLVEILRARNISTTVAPDPRDVERRPFVGLTRRFRDENTSLASRLVAFIFFVLNDRVEMNAQQINLFL